MRTGWNYFNALWQVNVTNVWFHYIVLFIKLERETDISIICNICCRRNVSNWNNDWMKKNVSTKLAEEIDLYWIDGLIWEKGDKMSNVVADEIESIDFLWKLVKCFKSGFTLYKIITSSIFGPTFPFFFCYLQLFLRLHLGWVWINFVSESFFFMNPDSNQKLYFATKFC